MKCVKKTINRIAAIRPKTYAAKMQKDEYENKDSEFKKTKDIKNDIKRVNFWWF